MIRRIYLKMTGPQILASVSSMLCLLIDSVVISRFLGVLPSTGQTALTISACVWSWIWWTRRCMSIPWA